MCVKAIGLIDYLIGRKFAMQIKTLKELEDYIKENCVECTKNRYGRKLYRVDLRFSEHLQEMKNVWVEYNACETMTKGDFCYDVPSWDMGVYGEEGDVYVYSEIKRNHYSY